MLNLNRMIKIFLLSLFDVKQQYKLMTGLIPAKWTKPQ